MRDLLLRRLLLAAVVLSILYPAQAQAPVSAPVNHGKADKPPGCHRTFTRLEFRQAVRESLKRPPFSARERRKVKLIRRCRATRTRYVGRRMRVHLNKQKRRYRQRFRWDIAWIRTRWFDKQWAVATSSCESGRNAGTNTGNGYFGAFQFSPPTARAAGFRVLPHMTSLHEQDVRSIRWRNVAGRGQWPNCG